MAFQMFMRSLCKASTDLCTYEQPEVHHTRQNMLHSVQCDGLLVLDDLIHQALSVLSQKQVFWTILLHPD